MALELSVCGLYVIPGREAQSWEGGNYWQEIATPDLSVALNFTRLRIATETLANGYAGTSFIAAAFHPGHIDRCPGIECADQPVSAEEEYQRFGHTLASYTVCGFYSDNFQTYSSWWSAVSPRMAYLTAFDDVQRQEGRYLFVSCVHEGMVERLAMPGTAEPPAFGDPLITTAEAMAEEMSSILGV
jgi:hypothetical protein